MKKLNILRCTLLIGMMATIVLTHAATTIWTGAVSTDWNTAANWSSGVPTSTDDAIILSSLNNPVIANPTNPSVHNLTINSGSITISGPYAELDIYGDLTVSTTNALAGDGTLGLIGSSGTVFGKGFTVKSIYLIGAYTLDPAMTGTVDVRGGVLCSNTLTSNGHLVLKSTAAYTGYLSSDGGWVSGVMTQERYIGSAGWHHLCSPVAATVSEWANDFIVSGPNGVKSATTPGTLQEYREAVNITATLNDGYYNYTSPSAILTTGKGYAGKIPRPTTVTTSGTTTTAPVTTTLTHTAGSNAPRGWNFIGNPYPCPVRWSYILNDNLLSPLNLTCYIWKTTGLGVTQGTWQAYNGTGVGIHSVGDKIASTQGFFVYTPSTTMVTISLNDLSPSDDAVSYKTASIANEIRLQLRPAAATGDDYLEAVAHTSPDSKDGYDRNDALLPPFGFNEGDIMPAISFHIAGDDYLIHSTAAYTATTRMPLTITTATAGLYEISAATVDLSELPTAYLYDRLTGSFYDLKSEKANVNLSSGTCTDRFSIVFDQHSATAVSETHIYHSATHGVVIERPVSDLASTVSVVNILGQEILHTTMTDTRMELQIDETAGKMYIVSVKDAQGQSQTQKIVMN